MTALIIEDEIPSGKYLEKLLVAKGFTVLKILLSVKAAVKWLKENNHPDLILTDIKLGDGLCFEIFGKVKITAKVVFTTAYNDYALKAFDYNSVDYLLKPVNGNKIDKMISKIDFFEKEKLQPSWQDIQFAVQNAFQTSFLVFSGNAVKKVFAENITFFVSAHNATFITTESRQFPVKHSLEHLETILNPSQFFRINRKYIVNKNAIRNVTQHGNLKMPCQGSEPLIVSRQRLKFFLDWYKK